MRQRQPLWETALDIANKLVLGWPLLIVPVCAVLAIWWVFFRG